MKTTHWIILILLASLAYTGFKAITLTRAVAVDAPEIFLIANEQHGTLKPQNDSKCTHSSGKGCIRMNQNTIGVITFTIQNGGGNKTATCDAQPPANWVITKVVLSPVGDPMTGKGTFPPTMPLPKWLIDAFPQIDPLTGVVHEPDADFATPSAILVDLNNNENAEPPKVAFYEVTARKCKSTMPPVVTDPSIKNYGK